MPNRLDIKIKPTFGAIAGAFDSVQINKTIREFIQRTAFGVERVAKQLSPYQSGTLRSSIATWFPMQTKGLTAQVGTYLNYASYVHFGTKYMRGRPFLYQAKDFTIKSPDKALGERIDKEFVRAFQRVGIKKYERAGQVTSSMRTRLVRGI
jgi:HK97 gp10 family phage protein